MVRDPNFWRRFSIAVHQDDAAKEEMTKAPNLKHSYVPSLSPLPRSPLASPTSSSLKSPEILPLALLSSVPSPLPPPTETPSRRPPPPKRPRSKLQKTPSTKPLLRPAIPQPPLATPPQPSRPSSQRRTSFPLLSLHRHTNSSMMSLSGRPQSSFKFWTTITADPPCRDSWLESQTKKQRQRTWICWCFWLGFGVLIASIVVTLLILKGKKII
ncbi:uncharacterized protein K460DRAFT_406582 [Cucurbitaria berberidis CBS 394.84]|uniref:Uncharacterized protein n=1 Tax=Cucurbitaria berberidis CBS 394.84 TaxID=1168544 RepID=A0A9P4GJ28_9PLEO|nr:uncharacterized protein K460DRAFT_406582 [Cucurbitaria berberidis CBS 394.84]KAF1846374.1 hypothetical protein K460DRAFT_406582 [Cucurbitaria berberidis CBS 394.84]